MGFFFVGTPIGSQELLLALHSNITPETIKGTSDKNQILHKQNVLILYYFSSLRFQVFVMTASQQFFEYCPLVLKNLLFAHQVLYTTVHPHPVFNQCLCLYILN